MKEPSERTKWILGAPDGATHWHWCEQHEDFHLTIRDAGEYEQYINAASGSLRETIRRVRRNIAKLNHTNDVKQKMRRA